jgi:hypothetical protein
MIYREAETVFEEFFAGGDFLMGLGQGDLRKARMGLCVSTDLLPRSKPIFYLGVVHERFGNIAGALLPFVGFPQEVGNQEQDRLKSMLRKHWQSIFKYVPETIIDSQKNPGVLLGVTNGECVERCC